LRRSAAAFGKSNFANLEQTPYAPAASTECRLLRQDSISCANKKEYEK
jgi:hypothetical protein